MTRRARRWAPAHTVLARRRRAPRERHGVAFEDSEPSGADACSTEWGSSQNRLEMASQSAPPGQQRSMWYASEWTQTCGALGTAG